MATITSSSAANPSVLVIPAHGFATGETVEIAGHAGSTPPLNGIKVPVTVTGVNTVTIPVNVTVGGTGGTATKVMMLATSIWVRQGTAAQLATFILGPGEWGYATDTKQMFYGDGVTPGGIATTATWASITGKPFTAASTGGNGAGDSGKAALYSTGGHLAAINLVGQRVVISGGSDKSTITCSISYEPALFLANLDADGQGLTISCAGTALSTLTSSSTEDLANLNGKLAVQNSGTLKFLNRTITAAATVGPQTIHKPAGTVNFAAGAASLVVTNNLVTATSLIFCQVRTNDGTLKSVSCVVANGSFTLHANAAATAETSVGFLVTN